MQLRPLLLGLGLATMVSTPALAQSQDRIILMARGGGFSALNDLNDGNPVSDTKTGYTLGGTVGYRASRYLVFRADGDYARDEVRNGGVDSNNKLNRYFYGGAVQLQYPIGNVTPYVLAGGGGVTIDQPNGSTKTKGQGTFGTGIQLNFPRSNFGVFLEGRGYVYKINGFNGTLSGFDKTQFDFGWTGGISLALF